jgi:DNA-binding transcriptional ArsR family regulator
MERNNLKKKMDAMFQSLTNERLRWLIGKGRSLIDEEKITMEKYETVMKGIFQDEMQRNMIINELKSRPSTVRELSLDIGLPKKAVLKHLIALRHNGIVEIGERKDELEFRLP